MANHKIKKAITELKTLRKHQILITQHAKSYQRTLDTHPHS